MSRSARRIAFVVGRIFAVRPLLFVAISLLLLTSQSALAQTANKYDYYRYPQQYAIGVNPLGQILGRVEATFEMRLDPNFTRIFEIVYQKDVHTSQANGSYPEAAYTIGARERLYLVDNAAMLGLFTGVGIGVGKVDKNVALRATAEVGYKLVFAHGTSHFYLEPSILLDSYIATNRVAKTILPYVALPFGYIW